VVRPVSFLSDYGRDDEFVGVVHGVIAKLAPEVRVIDITHGVPAGDVRSGALALVRAIQYLPEGVALAVVDPGVGTARRAIAAETGWGHFVGPDNGLLTPAVAIVEGAHRVVSIENPELVIPASGSTFEGRDRFAPAAALLASGDAGLDDLGPEIDPGSLTPLLLPLPEREGGVVRGEAWWVDTFGNVQTNVSPEDLTEIGLGPGAMVTVRFHGAEHEVLWVSAYADVDPGVELLHVDSYGLVALAVRGGRADRELGLVVPTAVSFSG
jgi:S-adenosyl-L-methionine hydrolase (adenosine-forming)